MSHLTNQITKAEVLFELGTHSLWTVDDVAEYLRLNPETVRLMARQAKIPCMKVGRVWRFRKVDIIAWLALRDSKTPN